MQVRMEEEGWKNEVGGGGTREEGWNNGLSGGDIAAVVLYFILVLGIGLYVILQSPSFSFSHKFKSNHHDGAESELQSMLRPNRGTIEGYFLAGKHMFWLPVRIPIMIVRMVHLCR